MGGKVGIAGPMSGPLRAYGVQLERLAVAQLGLPGQTLELVIVDDEANERAATSAAEALVRSGCNVVIGHLSSACAAAASKVYAAAEVPLLAPCASSPDLLQQGHGWVIRYCADDGAQLDCLEEFLRVRDVAQRDVVLRHDDSRYATSLTSLWLSRGFQGVALHCDSSANSDAESVVVFARYPSILERRAWGWMRSAELFVASDDSHVAEYADVPTQCGTFVIGASEGHAGLMSLAMSHLSRVLALHPGLRGRALLDELLRDRDGLQFSPDGQRLSARYRMFRVGANGFEVME